MTTLAAVVIGVVSKPQPAFATAPDKLSFAQAEIAPVVVSVALLGSLPPKTLALLVSVVPFATVDATVTGKVSTFVPLAAIAVVEVHVAVSFVLVVVETAHVYKPPFAPPAVSGAVNDMPAGRISLTVVVPLVAAEPTLLTVNVYVPVLPATKLAPASSFTKAKSGFWTQKPKAAKPTP
jgi:hypothetical protein